MIEKEKVYKCWRCSADIPEGIGLKEDTEKGQGHRICEKCADIAQHEAEESAPNGYIGDVLAIGSHRPPRGWSPPRASRRLP